jgi:hypothetical protein
MISERIQKHVSLIYAKYWTKVTVVERFSSNARTCFFAFTKPRWFEKKHIMFFPKSNYYI